MSEEILIVSSHYNEDLSWLHKSKYPVVVVSKNEAALDSNFFLKVHSLPNKGREFASYFWFICNYWDNLPSKVAFIHGHESSSHQLYGIFKAIDTYKNFDFHGLNGPRTVAYHYCFENEAHPWWDFCSLWSFMGMNRFMYCPRHLVCEASAQSLVSRNLIKSNPIGFYRHILSVITSHPNDHDLTLFLEVCWHVMFGRSPVDPEYLNQELNSFCLKYRVPILILGPGYVWHSKSPRPARFNDIFESDTVWTNSVLSILSTALLPRDL